MSDWRKRATKADWRTRAEIVDAAYAGPSPDEAAAMPVAEPCRLEQLADYIKGTPFKIGFFTALGGALGILGGSLARLTQRHTVGAA